MVHHWCNCVPNSANTGLDAGAVLRTQKGMLQLITQAQSLAVCRIQSEARLNLCSPKEHNVDETAAKDNTNQTPPPQPSDNPNNNSDDNDNNKDKGKSSDDDKEEPTKKREGPFVDLGYSKYEGNVLESNIHEYLGIRYAKAPTGDLRWRAPEEPESTTGTLKAQEVNTIQLTHRQYLILYSTPLTAQESMTVSARASTKTVYSPTYGLQQMQPPTRNSPSWFSSNQVATLGTLLPT